LAECNSAIQQNTILRYKSALTRDNASALEPERGAFGTHAMRNSPPNVETLYLFRVVGTSRCDVRAACSGATRSLASLARTFIPPATTRAGTAQRAIPT